MPCRSEYCQSNVINSGQVRSGQVRSDTFNNLISAFTSSPLLTWQYHRGSRQPRQRRSSLDQQESSSCCLYPSQTTREQARQRSCEGFSSSESFSSSSFTYYRYLFHLYFFIPSLAPSSFIPSTHTLILTRILFYSMRLASCSSRTLSFSPCVSSETQLIRK